jgi:hypothetical protein
MVDNAEETYEKLEAAGAKPMTDRQAQPNHFRGSGPRSYYEVKYRGPDAQEIDVTESGWIGIE